MSTGTIVFSHTAHELKDYPAVQYRFRYDELNGELEGFRLPLSRTYCFKKATIGVGVWRELETAEQDLVDAILDDERVLELQIAPAKLNLRLAYQSNYREVLELVKQAFAMKHRVAVNLQSFARA